MKQVTFKAGDFVYSIQQGWITLKNRESSDYPLGLSTRKDGYTTDGKFYLDDENRSLLLPEEAKALGIEVPKRKVVKEGWINIYKSNEESGMATGYAVHLTEELAIQGATKGHLGRVKISVEVEE